MLEPRQADLPALFLVLVVLPVVLYILLGKWSETSKRKERISLLVEQTADESFRAQAMAAASVIPVIPPQNYSFHECARCHGPATTRCSRCKSVRYCSGRCQIIHWRQGHKEECQPPKNMDSSCKGASIEEAALGRDDCHKGAYPQFNGCPPEQPVQERNQSDVAGASSATLGASQILNSARRIPGKRVSRESTEEILDSKYRVSTVSTDGNSRNVANPSKEAYTRNKLRGSGSINSKDSFSDMHGINGSVISDAQTDWRATLQENPAVESQNRDSLGSAKNGMHADEMDREYSAPNMNCLSKGGNCDEVPRKSFPGMVSSKGCIRSKNAANFECAKLFESSKSMSKATRQQAHLAKVRKGHVFDEPEAAEMGNSTSACGSNGITSTRLVETTGLKKSSKMSIQDISEIDIDSRKKFKVLFPYEEFTKLFEQEVFDLAPRGLLNCGNSCYANAVLQCLTFTKPLVIYLLGGTHSRACRVKNWCLMCELEQHVMMLKDDGGPLSPSRILSHMRSINCQIGNGSQEDAHEFLRLLVTSMQSICLEEVGGENQVHPSLQETTFIQQTFGGRLRSMVTCLRCHHKSERHENIMDLTLEIFGWVESLEDALTQFTTPEDLDGENMYRCGRCASYVRARKQLSIDEAPNILTIVLKRFQEGNYGKINKCITFPEMLDMIPFMTGTNDIPPLYMLYGVVVHVDTLNASFSGHYVSYVKDLQGNWFRIDDSVVQPVSMSQVMSEGVYILFYIRSFPRPPRPHIKKVTKQQAAKCSRQFVSKSGQSIHRANNRFTPAMETYADPNGMEFSDPSSSDWSLFTSSDEASFTSESTRDSFSTTEYSDTCNVDPFSLRFSTLNACERPSNRTVSCRMFSGSKPLTRYVTEQKGYILDSDCSTKPPVGEVQIGGDTRQVSVPFNEAFLSDYSYQNFVNYETIPSDYSLRTFSSCQV